MDATSKHILVTGGAGYIGSRLVPLLIQANKKVTLLDAQAPVIEDTLATKAVRFVQGDVKDPAVVADSLSGVDGVIYLAGVSDGRAGKDNPELTQSVNVDAFQHFVEAASRTACRRFVFASTFGVYGYDYTQPLTEKLAPSPQEPYSASKRRAEEILLAASSDRFITTSLRLAMVCGYAPAMRWDFLVNRMVKDALSHGKINVMGGSQVRPQIHIEDACRYMATLVDMEGQNVAGKVFNACGFNKSVAQIAEEIKSLLGEDVEVNHLPYRKGEHSFTVDQSLLEEQVGLYPRYDLAEAVLELKAHLFQTGNARLPVNH